jgi:hypothetical protein
LRLTDPEFWGLTLREFHLLSLRHCEAFRQAHSPAAMICAVMAEMKRDPMKRSEPFGISDFLPDPGREQKPQDHLAKMRELARIFGGKIENDPDQRS